MTNEYPTEKITKLNTYILNFIDDIYSMEDILKKLNEWQQRGITLNDSIDQLNSQINEWKTVMDGSIENFRDNILTLKKLDDRIQKDDDTNVYDLDGSYVDRWNYLYNIYRKIFDNLRTDIDILNNVKNDISKYEKLGVKLGEAHDVINEQINDILDGINYSLITLDITVEKIKIQSKKILSEDELNNHIKNNDTNDYLAVYAKLGFDANTFLLYFNNNTQIEWDPVVDGSNIKNHVKKALITSKSPIYDETIGSVHYNTGATELYQYFYYGFNKDEMIKVRILNEGNGASYQDEHGYQRLINSFYDKSVDHVKEMQTLFSSNGLRYDPGSQSSENLYQVFSVDEITDFSDIVFRGE